MNDYTFKRLTKDLIIDLYWLFKASSKSLTSYKKFEKKYNTDFAGLSYIGYLAYDTNNKPAAFYGVLPLRALIGDRKILIAQSADTLTHPAHRRKGLFIKLALMTYDLSKEEGMHFLFGIPNENSYPGFVKNLNWIHAGNLQKFEFKIFMLPFSQIFRKSEILNSFYQLWVSFILLLFPKGDTDLLKPNVSTPYFGIDRSRSFFLYKNYDKKHIIKVLGKSVWLKFEGTLKIGEIEKLSIEELTRIIGRLKIIAFFTGINKIQYQCSKNSGLFPVFTSIKKAEEALPIIFLNLSHKVIAENLVLSFADFDTF
jgi:hypothetical protein